MSRDEYDRYYTPAAMAEAIATSVKLPVSPVIWEPHCGSGSFVDAFKPLTKRLYISDIDKESPCLNKYEKNEDGTFNDKVVRSFGVKNFLKVDPYKSHVNVILGNPPYSAKGECGDAEQHVRHAVKILSNKENTNNSDWSVIFLLRIGFLASKQRSEFYAKFKPAEVHVSFNRPSFSGPMMVSGGTDSQEYAVIVWTKSSVENTNTEVKLKWLPLWK